MLLRRLVRPHVLEAARRQAERGVRGSMEAHATMDMSVEDTGPLLRRLTSAPGVTSTAGYFVMDWAAVWRDILGGLLIAGAFAAWVPDSFWREVFLQHHPTLSVIWGPLIGPLVAIVSFVCSIGNVPLAAVLWNGGISFGGVISFIYADLLILPILDIYRRYYGMRMTLILSGVLYVSMVIAGLAVDLGFRALGLVPSGRHAKVVEASVTLNYTTVLNAIFLVLAALLVWRFLKTGGLPMLRHMNDPETPGDDPHLMHAHDENHATGSPFDALGLGRRPTRRTQIAIPARGTLRSMSRTCRIMVMFAALTSGLHHTLLRWSRRTTDWLAGQACTRRDARRGGVPRCGACDQACAAFSASRSSGPLAVRCSAPHASRRACALVRSRRCTRRQPGVLLFCVMQRCSRCAAPADSRSLGINVTNRRLHGFAAFAISGLVVAAFIGATAYAMTTRGSTTNHDSMPAMAGMGNQERAGLGSWAPLSRRQRPQQQRRRIHAQARYHHALPYRSARVSFRILTADGKAR